MNNRGDFYIGNKRAISTTGEETTFDAPTPTVTGQDPSRLSVIFDEVVVKERIIIEGGKSNRVLSQFDGLLHSTMKLKLMIMYHCKHIKINNTLEIADTTQSNNKDEGCYVIEGGMGIEKNANIGGDLTVAGISTFTGLIDANGIIEGISGQNKIPSLYANYSDLPNAGTYHGMFAHVHAVGKGFFAHAGNWIELVSKETSGTVGTGTETYNIGGLTATGATIEGKHWYHC